MKILVSIVVVFNLLSACAKVEERTFIGEGMGYAGPIVVEVTMQGTEIVAIVVTSSEDTPSISTQAFDVVISRILEKQDANVDIVAGVTRSSQGLIDAVNQALDKAQ